MQQKTTGEGHGYVGKSAPVVTHPHALVYSWSSSTQVRWPWHQFLCRQWLAQATVQQPNAVTVQCACASNNTLTRRTAVLQG